MIDLYTGNLKRKNNKYKMRLNKVQNKLLRVQRVRVHLAVGAPLIASIN